MRTHLTMEQRRLALWLKARGLSLREMRPVRRVQERISSTAAPRLVSPISSTRAYRQSRKPINLRDSIQAR